MDRRVSTLWISGAFSSQRHRPLPSNGSERSDHSHTQWPSASRSTTPSTSRHHRVQHRHPTRGHSAAALRARRMTRPHEATRSAPPPIAPHPGRGLAHDAAHSATHALVLQDLLPPPQARGRTRLKARRPRGGADVNLQRARSAPKPSRFSTTPTTVALPEKYLQRAARRPSCGRQLPNNCTPPMMRAGVGVLGESLRYSHA